MELMAVLLFNIFQKINKIVIFAGIIFTVGIAGVQAGVCASNTDETFGKYSFDNFSASDFSTPFPTNFSGQIPLRKREMTLEQKEEIRLAREEMVQKKIPFTSEEFIRQIKKNKKDNVALMLKAGMSPNIDYFGEYALFYAVKFNKTEIAQMLLDKGADPNTGFDSVLFWAAKNNNTELAKALIEKGAKVNFEELVSSKTILYVALKKNNLELAKILINNGAKIDMPSGLIIDKKNLYDKLGVERF